MLKHTRLYSILFNKCPRCHKGDFFETNNSYRLKHFDKMHPTCKNCEENFNRETGFYYGAMYVSYGLAVLFGIALFLIMVIALDLEVLPFLIVYSISVIVLAPWLFRKSRLVWINLFVGYRREESV
jgi:uncharacterized protein (DUF983 family)